MIRGRFLFAIALACVIPISSYASDDLTKGVLAGSGTENALHNPFTLTIEGHTFHVPVSWVHQWAEQYTEGGTSRIRIRPDRIYAYLNQQVSPVVNDVGENSRFVFVDGEPQIKAAGRIGRIVDGAVTSLRIRQALAEGKHTAVVAMKTYRPPVLTMSDFLALGITDHLARGESDFSGSPHNRIHNIAVSRLRYQGIVVAPGEEFSFNHLLGPVTAQAGFLPELVIRNNVTTPEFGGGICQVSTTAFRAAVRAGLEITSWRHHSYPVRYYGTPGFDATIYTPQPDLRFRNTTGNWILIQTGIEGSKLTFDVYGKDIGRTVIVDGPYIVARRLNGTMRTLLSQTVINADGVVVQYRVFPSEYQPASRFPIIRRLNAG